MADQPSTPLVSDAEVETALAEAELEAIPSLDDGIGERIVPVPVQAPALPGAPKRTGAADSSPRPPPTPVPPEPGTVAAENATGPRRRNLGGLGYWAIDMALWAINRPFGWVPPDARRLIGVIAMVTLMTALLAPYLLPWLCPPRHL